jgi:predicted DsbA family dithiol-disulfide isomerase
MVRLIYYCDVLSSWCFYCEPNLDKLREKYGSRLWYEWRIALVRDLPANRAQVEWFYKRSGSISGSRLNPGWLQGAYENLEPNLAAEAARALGVTDDSVRRALSRAALVDGRPIFRRAEAVAVAASAGALDPGALAAAMDDPATGERIRRSGEEFDALHVDQRPGFVLRSSIGDMAVFSGIWALEPLDVTVRTMLDDVEKYERFAADNPPLPPR